MQPFKEMGGWNAFANVNGEEEKDI